MYTAVILGRCWIIAEKLNPTIVTKNRYPYAAVAELIYGKYMRVLVTVLLDMTVFGGGVPNLLVGKCDRKKGGGVKKGDGFMVDLKIVYQRHLKISQEVVARHL